MRVIGGWLCTPRTSTAEVTTQVTKRGKIAKRVLTIPAGCQVSAMPRPLLARHEDLTDRSLHIGEVCYAGHIHDGVYGYAYLNSTKLANKYWEMIQTGEVRQWSMAFQPIKQTLVDDTLVVSEFEMVEATLCAMSRNADCSIYIVDDPVIIAGLPKPSWITLQ